MSHPVAPPQPAPSPLLDLNTTPLIDVMLVLLILFIVTIPVQSHKVSLDLPSGRALPSDELSNLLVIRADGGLLWNGTPASERDVRLTLEAAAMRDVPPELHLRPDAEARYERVDGVLAMTRRAGVTRMGFVGNETYRTF